MQGIACLTTGQVSRQFSGEKITVANQTYIFAEDCKGQYIQLDAAYDTLSIAYDAAIDATEYCEQENELLKEDLQLSKVVSQSLEAEKIATEKALKKEVRKRRFNSVLLWSVSAATATVMVLYLVK